MKYKPNSRTVSRSLLVGVVVFGIASCGNSETSSYNTSSLTDGTVKPRTFCEVATESSKVQLGTGDGKSDSIKLYYANQVVAASSLATYAPSEIKEIAEKLRVSTLELFKIVEKFNFDLTKLEADAAAVKQIGELDAKYGLEASDAAMKKYLLEKCGITGSQQGVPTTVA